MSSSTITYTPSMGGVWWHIVAGRGCGQQGWAPSKRLAESDARAAARIA